MNFGLYQPFSGSTLSDYMHFIRVTGKENFFQKAVLMDLTWADLARLQEK